MCTLCIRQKKKHTKITKSTKEKTTKCTPVEIIMCGDYKPNKYVIIWLDFLLQLESISKLFNSLQY